MVEENVLEEYLASQTVREEEMKEVARFSLGTENGACRNWEDKR